MRLPFLLAFSAILLSPSLLLSGCGKDEPTEPLGLVGTGGTAREGQDLLIDDFEDGDTESEIPGSKWGAYDDNPNGGASKVTTPVTGNGLAPSGEGHDSSQAMLLEFTFDQADYEFEPFVGMPLVFSSPQDFSGYGGVSYWYRGHAHAIRIETTSVKDYDFFSFSLPAASSWTKVDLFLSDFRQAGWGSPVEQDFSSVSSISFQFRGATAVGSGSFELDDLYLLESGPVPDGPDMRILPASPPEKTDLGDISISAPFAQFATKALDKGYNITNWLEQEKFDGFGEFDETFVEKLADAGFKSLRLPIDLDLYVSSTDPLVVEEDLWTVLDSFDAWTSKYDLSFTIDYHQYDGNFDPEDDEHNALMAALWGEVAAHFAANEREDLFLELLNEPELSASGFRGPTKDEWTEISGSFLAAIRAQDADRPVIFGDVRWYDIDQLVSREPFADDYIVYSFHFYEPFIFTHQGASWAGMSSTRDLPYPYAEERWSEYYRDFGFSPLAQEAWMLSALEDYHRQGTYEAVYNRIAEAKAWAVEHQVPLVCNEFGVYDATSRKEDRVNYYTDLINIFQEQEISWQIWFTVMDAETGKVDPEIAEALHLLP